MRSSACGWSWPLSCSFIVWYFSAKDVSSFHGCTFAARCESGQHKWLQVAYNCMKTGAMLRCRTSLHHSGVFWGAGVLSGNKEVVGSDWRLYGEGVRLELLWRLLWLADSLHCRFLGTDWLGCSFTIAVCAHRGLRLVSVCSSRAGARAACWRAAPCVPFPCFASVYQACPGTRWLSSHSILFWCCYHIMKSKRTPAAVVIMFISIQQQHAFTSSKPTVSNCIYKPKEGGVLFSDVQSHLRDDAWHVRHQLWEHFAHVFSEAVWVTEMVLPLWCGLVHSVEQRNALTGPNFHVEVAFCPLKRLITSVENNRLW